MSRILVRKGDVAFDLRESIGKPCIIGVGILPEGRPGDQDFVESGICMDSVMGAVVKVHPLLHGAIPEPGFIWFIP